MNILYQYFTLEYSCIKIPYSLLQSSKTMNAIIPADLSRERRRVLPSIEMIS